MNTAAKILFALLAALPAAALPPAYFVSPQGNDAWSGTLAEPNSDATDGPVATPRRAQELLRTHATDAGLPEGGTIYLREGVYHLQEPIYISKFESGTKEHPVLWQAFRFEPVTLVCGTPIDPPTADSGPVTIDLSDRDLPPNSKVQVLWNDERLVPARWPNLDGQAMPGGQWAVLGAPTTEGFFPIALPVDVWAEAADVPHMGMEAVVFLDNQRQTILKVAELDWNQHRVRFETANATAPSPGARFYLQGNSSFLSDGEWTLDARSQQLQARPPNGESGRLTLASAENAFIVEGAHHVAILGVTLVGATGDAVVLENAEACLVARNTVKSAGGYGFNVNGGRGNRIAGNDILHSGAGGISLHGGERKSLTPGAHVAENNLISGFGEVERTYTPGVRLNGVGLRVANNVIRQGSHMGILWQGNDHLIEGNEIYDVCQQTAAAGAIQHPGRDWSERGTAVRHNRIHDVYGFGLAGKPGADGIARFERPCQAWGIYLDGAGSGTQILANELYRVPLAGIMIAGGRDNTIEKNVIIDCIPALHIDARWESFPWAELKQRLAEMNPGQPPFSERYPELNDMPSPESPQHNRFTKNVVTYQADDYRGLASLLATPESAVVYTLDRIDKATTEINHNLIFHGELPLRVLWRPQGESAPKVLLWDAWKLEGFDTETLTTDPGLLAPEEDDYTVVRSSPAFKLGFKVVPAERIGLYQDEFRASWPLDAPAPRQIPPREEFVVDTE